MRPEVYVTSVAAQLILPGVTSIPIAHTITAQTIILARLMEVLGATLTKMPRLVPLRQTPFSHRRIIIDAMRAQGGAVPQTSHGVI